MYKSIVYSIFIILGFWVIREKCTIQYYKSIMPKHSISNKIITYNIQRMPLSTKPLENLYELLKPYSIILLQECYLNILYDDIQHTFHDYNIVKGTMKGYRLSNSGLVILSKYPIISYEFVTFKNNNYLSSDILCEKGFLITTIQLNDKRLCIVNTHFQSNAYRNDYVIAQKQWDELHNYVNLINDPFIIGGDFNMPFHIAKSNYNLNGPIDPTIYIKYNDDYEIDTSCYKKDTYEPFVFDYFITKDINIQKPLSIDFNYSDHLPVSSKIDLL